MNQHSSSTPVENSSFSTAVEKLDIPELGKTFLYPTDKIVEFVLNPRASNPHESELKADIQKHGQTDALRVAPHPDARAGQGGILMITGGGNTRLRILKELQIPKALCIHWGFQGYLKGIADHMRENSLRSSLTLADKIRSVGLMWKSLTEYDTENAVKRIIATLEEDNTAFKLKKTSIYLYVHAYQVLGETPFFERITKRQIGECNRLWTKLKLAIKKLVPNTPKDSQWWATFIIQPAIARMAQEYQPEHSVELCMQVYFDALREVASYALIGNLANANYDFSGEDKVATLNAAIQLLVDEQSLMDEDAQKIFAVVEEMQSPVGEGGAGIPTSSQEQDNLHGEMKQTIQDFKSNRKTRYSISNLSQREARECYQLLAQQIIARGGDLSELHELIKRFNS